MKKIFLFLLFLTIPYFLILSPSLAQSKVLINEFLIDSQPQSVEILNLGTESADISDWIIDDSGGVTFFTIPKDSIIFPDQCLVFSADFNLNKSSADTVKLINNSILLDSFSYKSSSGSGISYLRFPDGSDIWTTGSANLGFYNQTDISCLITPSPTPTLVPTIITPTTPTPGQPTPTEGSVTPDPYTDLTVSPTPYTYNNIYISEAMINPISGDKEWVEIYNDNDFAVSLNSWYIDDLENAGSTPKIFSLDISGKSYAIFDLGSSIFNNDGDNIRLLDFNKSTKDDFEYQETEQGKTLGRASLSSDNFCSQEPSKNLLNNPCINPTPTLIISVKTNQINLPPTINKTLPKISISKANNFDVSIHRSINYPTGVVQKNISDNGDILGISNELIIQSQNNKSLINLLTILSTSYSLLTICSILIRMKLLYGKDKKFYSSFVRSS